MFKRIRRFINPTFSEWMEDFNKGLEREMGKPEVQKQIKILSEYAKDSKWELKIIK